MDIQEERRLRKEAEERLAAREFALTNALTEKDNTITEHENTIAELMKRLAMYESTQPAKGLQ